MRWSRILLLALPFTLGCDIGFLLPQNNIKGKIDVEIQDASGETVLDLHLEDEEGYFGNSAGAYQYSWPSFDEYGFVEEFAYIYFYPNFDGVQQLTGGQIQTPEGVWSLGGERVDFEVEWKKDRQFPFEHKGTFLGEGTTGLTVTGDFNLANPNCMGKTFTSDNYDTCGLGYTDGGSYDLTWSPNTAYQFCPQGVVDEVLGDDTTGDMSDKHIRYGRLKLKCVDGYNARHMCGQDPVSVEVDGCDWQVVVRGGPSGYSPESAAGWLVVSATTLCETATVNVCDNWFIGTVTE